MDYEEVIGMTEAEVRRMSAMALRWQYRNVERYKDRDKYGEDYNLVTGLIDMLERFGNDQGMVVEVDMHYSVDTVILSHFFKAVVTIEADGKHWFNANDFSVMGNIIPLDYSGLEAILNSTPDFYFCGAHIHHPTLSKLREWTPKVYSFISGSHFYVKETMEMVCEFTKEKMIPLENVHSFNDGSWYISLK